MPPSVTCGDHGDRHQDDNRTDVASGAGDALGSVVQLHKGWCGDDSACDADCCAHADRGRSAARCHPIAWAGLAKGCGGVVAGIAGTCLIIGVDTLGGIGQELWAQLAIVAATVCYAGAAIFGKRFQRLDPIMPAVGSLICGTMVLVPVSLIVERPWNSPHPKILCLPSPGCLSSRPHLPW